MLGGATKQVNAKNSHVDGSFIDPEKIRELARQVDVLTVEIEHVDTYVLEEIAENGVVFQQIGEVVRRHDITDGNHLNAPTHRTLLDHSAKDQAANSTKPVNSNFYRHIISISS